MNHVLEVENYLKDFDNNPFFLIGDAGEILRQMPDNSIDCCITSPPYWGQRSYENGGIGLENNPEDFIANLLVITLEIKRVLKKTGSFWLNLGDTYNNKSLVGIPWRTALKMTDNQDWTLRNSIIWKIGRAHV